MKESTAGSCSPTLLCSFLVFAIHVRKDFFQTRFQSLDTLTLDMARQDINIRLAQDMLV
jgi:hypothetical protein